MLHHVQKSIIDKLSTKDTARYAELKPDDMDGNQFTYHIKQLLSAKLIQRDDEGNYSLTKSGKTHLVYRYENPSNSAHTIFLVVIRCGEKLLLRKRLVQPMLGFSGFVHGEPSAEENLTDTIIARVKNKTGLQISDIKINSGGLIKISNNENIVESFSHAIIVTTEIDNVRLPISQDETGENFWINQKEIGSVENLLPSCQKILEMIDSGKNVWFDWSYTI